MEITLGGRKFEFEKVTIGMGLRFQQSNIANFVDSINPAEADKLKNSWMWKKFCRMFIKKDFKWKWLRIFPKELYIKNMSLKEYKELMQSFTTHFQEALGDLKVPQENLSDSSQKSIE